MALIPTGFRIVWNRYPMINMKGERVLSAAQTMDLHGSRFFQEIQAMPAGKLVKFTEARALFQEAFQRAAFGESVYGTESDPERACWLRDNWVSWLQEQGYQVVLDGTEWEMVRSHATPSSLSEISKEGVC